MDGRSRLRAGWLRVFHTLKTCSHQRMRDTMRAESGILAHVWHAIPWAAPAGEHHAASVELISKVIGGLTCGMAMSARSPRRSLCLGVEKTCDGVVDPEGR